MSNPRYRSRPALAARISDDFFPISARSLERWPLTWRIVNGHAVASEDEALAEARRRLDAAPPIRGGKRQQEEAA